MDGLTENPKKPVEIVIKVEPKFYAQSCPVCNSFGTLKHGTKVCQACKGRGYILVPTGMDGQKK